MAILTKSPNRLAGFKYPMTTPHPSFEIEVIDSHTAGEPTRCVLSGGPNLGAGPLSERVMHFRREYDAWRRAILCEPRGSDVLVGAQVVDPFDPTCAAGIIFFNNAGYLGMCGHGMIGVAATLAYLGRIGPGEHRIETPVGTVTVHLHTKNKASIHNVSSYRYRSGVVVDVLGFGKVSGDVAWGGNWFFLVREHNFAAAHALTVDQVEPLTTFTWAIRRALSSAEITGAGGAEIDHIELFTSAKDVNNHSRNFVLCPGKAYDRSPCGTGTSAKIACMAAEGLLRPGETWRQEGILGTVFEGNFEFESKSAETSGNRACSPIGRRILPVITGSAFVTARSMLIFDSSDPFKLGVPE